MPLDVVIEKHPAESFVIGLDFGPALATGRSLASATLQALDAAGVDVSATLLVSTTATISANQAKARLQNGTTGNVYTLIFTATLDDGEIIQDGLTVSVKSLP